ncbi:MAG: hypothetical protein K2O34_15675 [Acetatifactor sp.]|nr:hypothetical protein [Acetatifactor sp.]
MKISELADRVRTREDFVRFIYELKKDHGINMEEWANRDIPSYLEGVASWAEDMDGYYTNMDIKPPTNVDWRFLAILFYVGKIYE